MPTKQIHSEKMPVTGILLVPMSIGEILLIGVTIPFFTKWKVLGCGIERKSLGVMLQEAYGKK